MAVVLEYLDHLKKNVEIPQITGQDQRIALLQGFMDEEDLGDEYEEEEEKIDTGYLVSSKDGKLNPVDLKGFLENVMNIFIGD